MQIRRVILAFVSLAALASWPNTSTAAPPKLAPLVVWVPVEHHTGGAYTAIQSAPDGSVYLGTTVYDGFARFLVLPPGSQAFRLIADMGTATGEKTPGAYAQAKIHTKPVVALDGRVYFGTKSGKPANDPQWQAAYPGGHLLVYDPSSGRVTDLGIPKARQSIIALGIDRRRGLVLVLTDPEGHLLTYDPSARTFTDRGRLAFTPQPTRYLPVLGDGTVYHPAGPDAFMRYDPAGGRIDRIPLRFVGEGRYDRSDINDGPYAMAVSSDGRRFYGVGDRSGQVYTFIPAEGSLTAQMHGALPLESAQRTVYYTIATGLDGNAYYTATLHGGAADGAFYILRLNVRTSHPEIVGQVGALPPPPAGMTARTGRLMVQGSTVGPDGSLYVMLAYPLRVLIFPRLTAP